MQSKYKVGLMRVNLLIAAGLASFLAITAETLPDALLLGLAALWLTVTASQAARRRRHPATVPWQLLPGLLLAALLWVTPDRHLTWLWAWAILLMVPQPRWVLLLNAALAVTSWWHLRPSLDTEQWALAGLLLAGLMLLGLARALELQALQRRIRHRARLLPGLPLWPSQCLRHDVQRERERARREDSHVELVLLHVRRRQLWPLAERLCQRLRPFENGYRLDRRTLALLLIHRDAEQAAERRRVLLADLDDSARVRVIALPRLGSLSGERRALKRQARHIEAREIVYHD
ncbi:MULTISPECIES: hypothetical protein [Halomonas]|uniref:GGDEF domain-containing protein n=1 Tax=Halomonas halophila TaxID=29573 RepID=A0ABQ0U1N0_9GAMM|nr:MULTISPECIES: hypothetical protein [Halomonas]MDR5888101.1 hypothetical protein [Halomonas salina]WJY08624.1 hypothetical protein QWG60_06885 [Halomonas halophila]GEK72257.1 hypothetical protein HHA04nite_08010 [Halomonas halophila]